MGNERVYPITIVGLYKNNHSEKLRANTMQLDQDRANQICEAIQACVGGQLEIKQVGGTGRNGKKLPDFFLEGVTPQILAERKSYGAQKRQAEGSGNDPF
jgi:hypothetical protein